MFLNKLIHAMMCITLTLTASFAWASPGDSFQIGEENMVFLGRTTLEVGRRDSDLIPVAGQCPNAFQLSAIQVRAVDKPIYVESLTVLFGNGQSETFDFRDRPFMPGEASAVKQFRSGLRCVESLYVTGSTDPRYGQYREGTVAVFGSREYRWDERPGDLTKLGTTWLRAGQMEREQIFISNFCNAGNLFEGVELAALVYPVYVENLMVEFTDGRREMFDFRNAPFQPGQRSALKRFSQGPGCIRMLEITGFSATRYQEGAIEIWGRHAQGVITPTDFSIIGRSQAGVSFNTRNDMRIGLKLNDTLMVEGQATDYRGNVFMVPLRASVSSRDFVLVNEGREGRIEIRAVRPHPAGMFTQVVLEGVMQGGQRTRITLTIQVVGNPSQGFDQASATASLEKAYIGILWRRADSSGVNTYVPIIVREQMAGWRRVLQSLATSQEFMTNVRNRHNDNEILDRMYQGLLGRHADPSGQQTYLPMIRQGRYADVAIALGTSREFLDRL